MNEFTTSDLTALNAAISAGVLKVTHNGKSVDFASFDELVARRDFVKGQINGAVVGGRVRFASFSKGRG